MFLKKSSADEFYTSLEAEMTKLSNDNLQIKAQQEADVKLYLKASAVLLSESNLKEEAELLFKIAEDKDFLAADDKTILNQVNQLARQIIHLTTSVGGKPETQPGKGVSVVRTSSDELKKKSSEGQPVTPEEKYWLDVCKNQLFLAYQSLSYIFNILNNNDQYDDNKQFLTVLSPAFFKECKTEALKESENEFHAFKVEEHYSVTNTRQIKTLVNNLWSIMNNIKTFNDRLEQFPNAKTNLIYITQSITQLSSMNWMFEPNNWKKIKDRLLSTVPILGSLWQKYNLPTGEIPEYRPTKL